MPVFDDRILQNPFGVKLTIAFRCAIYADHKHRGTSYATLAKTFGVHHQTAQKICQAKPSGLYHSVFAIADGLGIEEMWNRYVRDGGVLQRINNAAYERTLIATPQTGGPQQDSGSGKYWLVNSEGNKTEVDIQPYETIRSSINQIYGDGYEFGFWYKHPQIGWTFTERPFTSIGEALRYFHEYPPRWK